MESIEMGEVATPALGTFDANGAVGAYRIPALPWRDPHSVTPEKLAELIGSLENACVENPRSADLRTCLGMAYAMNYDPYRSMDALEEARKLAPENFLAQCKYAELMFRLRLMDRAEEETSRALALASNGWEISTARKQLAEVRRIRRNGIVRGGWTGSLRRPALAFVLLLAIFSWVFWIMK